MVYQAWCRRAKLWANINRWHDSNQNSRSKALTKRWRQICCASVYPSSTSPLPALCWCIVMQQFQYKHQAGWGDAAYDYSPHNKDGKTNKGNESTPNAYHSKHPIVDLIIIWNINRLSYHITLWLHKLYESNMDLSIKKYAKCCTLRQCNFSHSNLNPLSDAINKIPGKYLSIGTSVGETSTGGDMADASRDLPWKCVCILYFTETTIGSLLPSDKIFRLSVRY